MAFALGLVAVAVVGAALVGLHLIGRSGSPPAASSGPWLVAAGFMFGAGITLLVVALSVRRRRDLAPAMRPLPAWLTPPAAAAMLVAGVTLAGTVTYRLSCNLVERSVLHRLETAAGLKESLLQAWFEDAHEDLRLWTQSATFANVVETWRTAPDAGLPRAALLGYLWERAVSSHYREVAVCQASCSEPLIVVADPEGQRRARAQPASGIARTDEPAPVQLIQPLNLAGETLYVRVSVDPRHQLARLVERWPGESLSGELLLVQPEGDSLLVIPDENDGSGAAPRRVSADQPGLLAQAVAHPGGLALPAGLSEGGEPLIAWAQPVSGTRWLLLAKIDQGEAFGELRRVFGIAATLTTVIVLLGLWWAVEQRRYAAAAQDLLQERAAQAQQVADLSRRLVSAQDAERRRMAAELHDHAGANLAAIQMNLKALERRLDSDDEDDQELVRESRGLLAATVVQIRDFCADLRPAALDYAGPVEAIEAAATRAARRCGADVQFDGDGYRVRQPADAEGVLFRLAQEALLNCAKHSKARSITVRLASSAPGQVRLEVADDGVGFDPIQLAQASGGIGQGMLLMRERAEFLRGRLRVDSAPGRGTRVVFEQP